ncbi:MAG: polyketide synthase, partial [bacterium]|nr:polyketide synthase [bacterium]
FTKGIDQFEPECFGISPREAAYIDPQQRLLLEVAWEAVEDGGQPVEKLAGTDTGVFIGISTSDYANIQADPYGIDGFDPHSGTGGSNCIAANRISYCLNLLGPSIAVDTACSSSLVATHLACRSLWEGECEMALVGGVNALLTPAPFVCFCAASMLSPTGRCRAFDAGADGFVRAEGAGAVLLKPLSRALAEGDPVYALVVGTAVNQDGRTSGISAPSQSSQEELLRTACRQAGVAPKDICYVEAHGTGTAVGDPIETTALGNVLSQSRPDGECCIIGSVKTNIGHMEAGAGMAGLIKACLISKHRQIPPSLHFKIPNPAIRFRELKLRVPVSLEPLVSPGPAILGVNSFGFGGTNAHAVVREFRPIDRDSAGIAVVPPNRRRPRSDGDAEEGTGQLGVGARSAAMLLPLAARSSEALEAL